MTIDDQDRGSTGSSDKSPTKWKERPTDRSPETHPENVPPGESSGTGQQKVAPGRPQDAQELRDLGDAIRAKVRRTIPKPGHPGMKPAANPSDKGVSAKDKRSEDPEQGKGTPKGGL